MYVIVRMRVGCMCFNQNNLTCAPETARIVRFHTQPTSALLSKTTSSVQLLLRRQGYATTAWHTIKRHSVPLAEDVNTAIKSITQVCVPLPL